MRVFVPALVGAFVLMTASAYADDVMSNTYGNTVTTKDMTSGAVSTLMFNQDGTYSGAATGADGKSMSYSGKWTLEGSNICLAPQGAPAAAPGANCSPVSKHAVGETWNVTTDKGMTYQVSLTAGR